MKKFFIVLGIIFAVLLAIGATGIGVVVMRGNALDKQSKAYADDTIHAIVDGWNGRELLQRASPEFKKIATQQQIDQQFQRFSAAFGRLQKLEPAHGQSVMSATTLSGGTIKAEYATRATFEKGEARIQLDLIKHGDQWQILGFFFKPPELPAR